MFAALLCLVDLALTIDHVIEASVLVRIHAHVAGNIGDSPDYHHRSTFSHSRYTCRLADLPILGIPVGSYAKSVIQFGYDV